MVANVQATVFAPIQKKTGKGFTLGLGDILSQEAPHLVKLQVGFQINIGKETPRGTNH